MLNVAGWIDFAIPVSVGTSLLGEEHFSCEEPEGSALFAAIVQAVGI